jgi:hypothetical protein
MERPEQAMARVPVLIVHDEIGRIVSIARPAAGAKVVVVGGNGQSVFKTEVDEESIIELAGGAHRVDAAQESVIPYPAP